ncbi:MBL fold metallo-hydrolase [Amycolatopsis sp. NPDC058986]|uniref:MBL fold metallo-hydrolase n=1 Tax=unclassified Amycolatopsis TaxID=2618356 RepID=UPI00366D7614
MGKVLSRRGMLSGGVASGLLALGACSAAEPQPPGTPPVPKTGMHLVPLGTKGGPTLRSDRSNPANALIVDGVVYVVDCGMGVSRQLVLAGLELSAVRAVFITHHHSDHNLEFGNLLNAAWNANLTHRIGFHAPPGMEDMLAGYLAMNRFDIDLRIADQGLPDPRGLAEAREFTGDGEVYRDDLVRVTAARNNHPPVTESYALRFDTRYGSVVFSGDTTPFDAVVRLAQGADWLVHEVLHLPSLDKLLAAQPTETRLKEHLLASHTTNEQVANVALEAKVRNLVLTHLVSFGPVTDAEWERSCRGAWRGPLVVAADLRQVF